MERKPTDTVQLKLRLREELRQKLEEIARSKKISLNATIVEKIEKSLAFDNFIMPAERQDLFWICSIFIGIIRAIENKTGKSWTNDSDTFAAAKQAMVQFLTQSPSDPAGLGDMVARALVQSLSEAEQKNTGETR